MLKHTLKTASNPDSIFSSLLIVPEGSDEWVKMWKKLAKQRINRDFSDPGEAEHCGEVWEYMESTKAMIGYNHMFRHRLHPKTNRQITVTVKSSFGLVIIPNNVVENC